MWFEENIDTVALTVSNWLTMVSTLYTVLCVHVFCGEFGAQKLSQSLQ